MRVGGGWYVDWYEVGLGFTFSYEPGIYGVQLWLGPLLLWATLWIWNRVEM